MAAVFGGCCGLGEMQSLDDRPDAKMFSPILSLDSYVADWAYDYFKEDYNSSNTCCTKLCNKFPKRKHVDINIVWDSVRFIHSAPVDADAKDNPPKVSKKAAAEECNGNEAESGIPLSQKHSANNVPPKDGLNPKNFMESLHEESFSVKFENTTDKPCTTTLSSERTVKASYEVDIHRSVQIEHNVQLSLGVGGEESMGKVEGSYEFNKMLEQYKGEKTSKEMETTLHTECPVEVLQQSTTEAKFVTTYQNFKKTLHVASKFSGQLNVEICERKKNSKKRYYKHLSIDVADVFEDLKNMGDSPLSRMITIEGTRPHQMVAYTSSATFSTSYGVDQNVKILNYPLPSSD